MEIQSQHTSTFRDKKGGGGGGGVLFFSKEKSLNTALKPRTSVQTAFNKLETRYNEIARSVRQQIMVISLPCGLEGMGGREGGCYIMRWSIGLVRLGPNST